MIDFEDVENRFQEDEGDRLERKRSASDLDTLRKAATGVDVTVRQLP